MSSFRIRKCEGLDLKPYLRGKLEDITQKYMINQKLSKNALDQSMFTEALSYITDENSICFVLTQETAIHGVIVIQKSNWDSRHFGYGIGKYRLVLFNKDVPLQERIRLLKMASLEAAALNMRLVISRVPLHDSPTIHALELIGSILTDVLITFHKSIENNIEYSQPKGYQISPGNVLDEDTLFKIGKKIFRIDHFHADPYLEKERCDDLYGEWARNSIKSLADQVLVARKRDKILGFITCCLKKYSIDSRFGFIDLVGVDNDHSGRGIGGELVKAALAYFSKHTNSVYVGTQAMNIPAMRLYTRMEFKPVFSEVTLHQWM